MKIGIIGSLGSAEKFIEIEKELKRLGHQPYTSKYVNQFFKKSRKEIEEIKETFDEDVLKEFWDLLQRGDAVLVLNYDKRGIKNYIGGNTLIEMAYAYLLGQKIYLLNPIPEIQYYYDEIRMMKPIVLDGDLGKVGL